MQNYKNLVHSVTSSVEYDNSLGTEKINYLITSVILYNFLLQQLKVNSEIRSNIKGFLTSYVNTFKNIVETLHSKYVSYATMLVYLKEKHYSTFLEMSDSDIDYITKLYENKTQIETFSLKRYSPNMYNLFNISYGDNINLSKVHFNVMVPIVNYYIKKYDITMSDIEIYSVNSISSNVGKEIIFRINGIPLAQLINDININCGISEYVYSTKIYYSYVSMVLK